MKLFRIRFGRCTVYVVASDSVRAVEVARAAFEQRDWYYTVDREPLQIDVIASDEFSTKPYDLLCVESPDA